MALWFCEEEPLGKDTTREWTLSSGGALTASGCTSSDVVDVILEFVLDWRERLEEEVFLDLWGNSVPESTTLRELLIQWWGVDELELRIASKDKSQ